MRHYTAVAAIVLAGGLAAAAPAHAQLSNLLNGAGGMSMPSIGSASSGNVAGVLKYCMRNNYVGGGAASTESGLLGKLGGGTTSSSQYEAGNQGTLQTGNGNTYSLAGNDQGSGGLKAKVTQKICDQVLKHAKSLL